VKEGILTFSGHYPGRMTERTADGAEQTLPSNDGVRNGTAFNRRQKLHKGFEVVDTSKAGSAILDIFDRAGRTAKFHLSRIDAQCKFIREKIIRDSHLVTISIGGKSQQCRLLRLPPEPADAVSSGCHIIYAICSPTHPITIAVIGVLKRQDSFIGNGLNQAGAEQGYRHTVCNHVGVIWNLNLASVPRSGEYLK